MPRAAVRLRSDQERHTWWISRENRLGQRPQSVVFISNDYPEHWRLKSLQKRRAFASFRISRAALWPGAPVTPPPGCVPAPHI